MASEPATSARRTLRSVGAQLALATALLVVLVSSAIYVALTRHERESLLEAKRRAAEMVALLFAEALSAPLVFGDDQGVEESLAYLKSNLEVEQAAVFKLDEHGKPSTRLAELRRASGRAALPVPNATELGKLRMGSVWLDASHWVRDASGQRIGATVLRFSLLKERRRYESLSRNILLVAAALAVGLTLLLLLLARVYIIGPLGALRVAASRLQGGAKPSEPSLARLPLAAQNEVGDLARTFVSMAEAIERREHAIASQNREMRLVLESVGQGFLVLGADGGVIGQHSAIVDRWFGPLAAGRPLWEHLRAHDPQQAEWLELAWSNLGAPGMPLELCLEQMPKRFEVAGKSYDFEYRPSCTEPGVLARMVVIISDVSELVAREQAEREQRELAGVLGSLASDRSGFMSFFEEAAATLQRIATVDDQRPERLLQDLHTLKGNAGLFHMRTLARLCEELETRLAAEGGSPSAAETAQLARCFARTASVVEQLTGHGTERELSLMTDDYAAIERALRDGASGEHVLGLLVRATAEPAEQVLARLANRLRMLASQLGKGDVDVRIAGDGLRFPRLLFAPLWAALVHALRNTADHGLETRFEREQTGKQACAQVVLRAELRAHKLLIRVIDDGRGVDFERVKARAAALGLKGESEAELLALLFEPGFSTAGSDSALSGRGVGLAAIRTAARELGGTVAMHSTRGQGCELTIELPASLLGTKQ